VNNLSECKTPLEWLLKSNDTGQSSKTILAAITGVEITPQACNGSYDIPYDPSDFGRCYRLVKLFNWKDQLYKVGEVFPKWQPYIKIWDNLEYLYENSQNEELWRLLNSRRDEAMKLDGWEKQSDYHYTRREKL
jgi:hypothetical protein